MKTGSLLVVLAAALVAAWLTFSTDPDPSPEAPPDAVLAAHVPDAPPAPPRSMDAPAPGAPTQGVVVRGAWTIEVRDPDGTLVSRRAFQNAYVDGDNVLVKLLTSAFSMGALAVSLRSSTAGDSVCVTATDSPTPCLVVSPEWLEGTPEASAALFLNLVVATDKKEIVLTGSAVASRDGVVDTVKTLAGHCAPDVAPSDCGMSVSDASATAFTSHTLDTPIPIAEEQKVSFEVHLTFGAAP